MRTKKAYYYQISTNPIVEGENQVVPYNDYEENFSFTFVGDILDVTGMNNSIEKTIEAIKNSALVFIIHSLDFTAYFELGLAISLGKKVYYVTEHGHAQFDFQLPYEVDNLIPITYQNFIKVVNEL